MPQNTLKILAPAGDANMLRAAVFSGADCVYVGVEGFNARRTAGNFNAKALVEAVSFCHARNCKIYAALNILLLPGEEARCDEAIQAVANAGCDAIIVQDLGVAARVQQIAPSLPLFASTQMSVHSLAGLQMLARLGFAQGIVAREISEPELAGLAALSPIPLEIFVHGALCICMSGQCLLSSSLGGRSANRGACAGPCRLPFLAEVGTPSTKPSEKSPLTTHDLSLRDLSILDALPRLEAMGIAAAKIEGRLRSPEYCATVVDSAQKALHKQPYDKAFLRDIFSRDGLTDGWFAPKSKTDIFGSRTAEDSAASRAALPKARDLYRRERPRVRVSCSLTLSADGAVLQINDGANCATQTHKEPLVSAQNSSKALLEKSLGKMGGTPFYTRDIELHTNGFYLSPSAVSAMRTKALEELLLLREKQHPIPVNIPPAVAVKNTSAIRQKTPLRLLARFDTIKNVPKDILDYCSEITLPLFEASEIPQSLRKNVRLALPRAMFGELEKTTAEQVGNTTDMGFLGYEASNLAHFKICDGLPLSAGFGMNITNARTASVLQNLGCTALTLSPELSLKQARTVTQSCAVPTGLLAYGHLPTMLTRACPLQQYTTCAQCPKHGVMVDRKGMHMPLLCRDGMREIYNPIPLWMGDRLQGWPAQNAVLYFTQESALEASEVLAAFIARTAAPYAFTRGLYNSGLA